MNKRTVFRYVIFRSLLIGALFGVIGGILYQAILGGLGFGFIGALWGMAIGLGLGLINGVSAATMINLMGIPEGDIRLLRVALLTNAMVTTMIVSAIFFYLVFSLVFRSASFIGTVIFALPPVVIATIGAGIASQLIGTNQLKLLAISK